MPSQPSTLISDTSHASSFLYICSVHSFPVALLTLASKAMRFCPSLQLFAAFICFASSIPHALAHPSLPPQLTQTLFSLTRTDHELRDAAMAIMEGAASHEHPVAHRLLHRRGRYSIYLPNHKAGYPPARDSLYNINAVLDELSIYFPDLAQDIRDAIGIMQTASSMSLTPLEPPSTTSQLEQPSTSALPPTHPPDTPITTPVSLPTSRTQPTPTPITSLGEPVIATPSSTSPPPSSSTYTFNPQRRDLNVAYYAQSPPTTQVPFLDLCSDPSIDIILLSFITDFFSVGGFPTLNLASKCWGLDSNTLQGATAIQKGVSGLIDCISPGFAKEVAQCQTSGKKVMLSAGGAKEYSNLNMPSEQKAIELAGTIWSLFLGGTDPEITPLRPFGNVTLDGIDIGRRLRLHIQIPTDSSRQRRSRQRSPSIDLRLDPSPALLKRHLFPILLPLRRTSMPTPRRLNPGFLPSSKPRLCIRPILQQPFM